MKHYNKLKENSRTSMIGVRVDAEQKRLIDAAAEREGLQISSFIIMILVRVHILPDSCLDKLKRCPVPYFNALHGVLGVVNHIGGNCKQLSAALPHASGLRAANASILHAAAAITDALQGKAIPEGVNLYRLEGDLTKAGYAFNDIVRSVNMGKPQLSNLGAALASITQTTDAITATLTGQPVQQELRVAFKMAAAQITIRQRGDA